MKKKFLFIVVAAAALYAGYHAHEIQNKTKLAGIVLANVEALAQNDEYGGEMIKCYSSTKYKLGASVVVCSTCEERINHTDALFCIHDFCYRRP